MNKQNRIMLRELHNRYIQKKYPHFPPSSIPIFNCNDSTANSLTKIIIAFLKYKGYQAERINVISRQINGKHIKSTMQKGTADISATILGKSVKIEVKIGKDVQSDTQKKYQQQIEDAGGLYFIAKDFESFFEWCKATFNPTVKKI
jgi:hypothetical protein